MYLNADLHDLITEKAWTQRSVNCCTVGPWKQSNVPTVLQLWQVNFRA